MNVELWSEIPDYPKYEVSDHGRVRNIVTNRVLKNSPNPQGYEYVTLYNDFGSKVFGVHRLVGEVYLDDNIDGFEINHIDLNKSNNVPSNLEVQTPVGNTMHAYLSGAHERNMEFYPAPVRDVETGEEFESLSSAARALGVTPQRIHKGVTFQGSRIKGRLLERSVS